MRYLKCYIQDGYKKLNQSNRRIEGLRNEIRNMIPSYLLIELEDVVSERKVNYRQNLKQRLQSKFESLQHIRVQNRS